MNDARAAELCALAQRGDVNARNQIVLASLALIDARVNRWSRRGFVSGADLRQEGALGVMRAVDLYEPRKGPFFGYAHVWINSRMSRACAISYAHGHGSVNAIDVTSAMQNLIGHGSAPDDALTSVSERFGITPETIVAMVASVEHRPVPIDEPAADDATLAETLADGEPTAEERIAELEAVRAGHDALSTLGEREQIILRARLLSDEETLLQELGDGFGITRERVRQLEERALGLLRKRTLAALQPASKAPPPQPARAWRTTSATVVPPPRDRTCRRGHPSDGKACRWCRRESYLAKRALGACVQCGAPSGREARCATHKEYVRLAVAKHHSKKATNDALDMLYGG